jgi:hypothetical protein
MYHLKVSEASKAPRAAFHANATRFKAPER